MLCESRFLQKDAAIVLGQFGRVLLLQHERHQDLGSGSLAETLFNLTIGLDVKFRSFAWDADFGLAKIRQLPGGLNAIELPSGLWDAVSH